MTGQVQVLTQVIASGDLEHQSATRAHLGMWLSEHPLNQLVLLNRSAPLDSSRPRTPQIGRICDHGRGRARRFECVHTADDHNMVAQFDLIVEGTLDPGRMSR
jgi:hypothetical protein